MLSANSNFIDRISFRIETKFERREMLTLLSEVKFLTTSDEIDIKDDDFGASKYVAPPPAT